MEQQPMSKRVHEVDRLMALRMIVPFSEIPAESLEAYWTYWKAVVKKDRDSYRIVAKEYEALELGEAVLRLWDGSRWVSAGALLDMDVYDDEVKSDNTFLWHLHRVLVEHKMHVNHFGPLLPQVFLRAETLDLSQSFCVDCWLWLNLDARP
jgi:hypothetical protein